MNTYDTQKKKHSFLNSFTLLTLLLLVGACGQNEKTDIRVRESTIVENTTLPETTTYFSESEINDLVQSVSSDGTITVSSDIKTISLAENDILVFGISDKTPEGMLREIRSIEQSDDQLIISTRDATLSDAIENGTLQKSIALDLNDVVYSDLIDGVTLGSTSGKKTSSIPISLNTSLQSDVQVDGEISFIPTVYFSIDFSNFSIDQVEFETTFETEASLNLSVSSSASLSAEKTLGTLYLKPISIGILVVVPKLTLKLGADGSVNVGMETSTTRNVTATGGLHYDNGNWSPISSITDSYQVQPWTPVGTANASLALKPSIELLVYGLVGPSANLSSWVNYDADLQRDPCWIVNSGISGNIGINMNKFTSTVSSHTEELEITTEEIGRSTTSCQDVSELSGQVRNAITNEGLSSVEVSILSSSTMIAQAYTDSQGRYNLEVPAGENYTLQFVKSGFISAERFGINILPNSSTVVEALLQIDEQYSGLGNFGGMISNAITGQGEPSVLLSVRNGLGNTTGTVLAETFSNTSGYYEIQGLEAGNYTMESSKSGFFTTYFSVLVLGETTMGEQNGTIAPESETGQVRIVLEWGATPRDLDSHLTGPSASGDDRFHVYYSNRNPNNEGANLDTDDTSSFGPETITISEVREGVYRYSVFDYSNGESSFSTELANSSAKVRLILDNGEVTDFYVPSGEGTLWTVFEIQNGIVVPVNSMSYASNSSSIARVRSKSDAHLLRDLPRK